MSDFIGYILLSSFGTAILVIVLIIWGIQNFEKFEKMQAWFLSIFSWLNYKWEYARAAKEMQASINTAGANINKQANSILPHAMKIEFVKNAQEVESFLRKGEVIIKLGYKKDRDHNLVMSTLAYVKKDLLANARLYVDEMMMKATDFTVIRDILHISKKEMAISLFQKECYEPETVKNPEIIDNCITLEKINKFGYFYRIFLLQLKFFGDKLFPSIPTIAAQNEVKDFTKYLLDIAQKERGEYVNLSFVRPRIRMQTLLVAKEETKQRGTIDYERRIILAHSNGIEYIYICAQGIDNCNLAKKLASEQEIAGRITIINKDTYTRIWDGGPGNIAICISCAVNLKKSSAEMLQSPDVFIQLLEQHVVEIRDGKIQIIAIARKPGIRTKIIVKELVSNIDAAGCINTQIENGDLGTILASERLDVIKWQNKIEDVIISSIFSKEVPENTSIRIDNSNKVAYIRTTDKNMSKAIGRDGINVKLANQLTGWHIEISKLEDKKFNSGPIVY
jgi:transcription antitermination factor NusA-like protein